MDLTKYIITFVLQLLLLLSIWIYGIWLNTHDGNKECNDILNHTIFQMRIFVWNILHTVIFFVYCVIVKPVSIIDHIEVFGIGIIWFMLEYTTSMYTHGNTSSCPDVSYENIFTPRLDDFIYNILGQVIYIVCVYFSMTKT